MTSESDPVRCRNPAFGCGQAYDDDAARLTALHLDGLSRIKAVSSAAIAARNPLVDG
ncbi:hypothetical protein [Streptomyces sp. NBC_01615]|uniref:hypothetical protein n=1 Tax=Streptomyces sp. NBC_01615 TaxID=2975898 RepID=UPI00386EFAEC